MSPNSAPEPFKDHRQTALTPALRWTMAAGIIALLACELFLSVRQESQVFDEEAHLYSGVEYRKHGDFGMNPEHPPLAKLVAALPVLPMDLKDAPRLPIPHFKAETFIRASIFLYAGDADSLLMRARIAVAL